MHICRYVKLENIIKGMGVSCMFTYLDFDQFEPRKYDC